jgi:hypothetical protein
MRPSRTVFAGLFLSGMTAVGVAASTGSAAGVHTAQLGRVVLHQTLDNTGPTATVTYANCQPPSQHQPRLSPVVAFDNQPPPGCQVALINSAGATSVLCAGRGVVPVEFRQDPRVRVQPGTSRPCGIGTAGSAG